MDLKQAKCDDQTGANTPRRWERWALVLVAAIIGIVGLRHLPPGVCLDDPGDLQCASATLGIAHPPGYVGYAAVGWGLCRVLPFVEPAYVVSVACLACMVLALVLLSLLLVRAGLHVLLAAGIALILLSHRYVWQSLVVPEVYAPTLAGVLGSACLLLRYARTHRTIDLYIATALFGFVVINRPPVALMTPGFAAAWIVIERRSGTTIKSAVHRLLLSAVCGLAPMILITGLLMVRDTPTARYNYMTDHDDGRNVLPQLSDGWPAKLKRAAWVMTSVQYRDKLGADLSQMRAKWRYLRRQLHVYEWQRFACVLLLLAAGTWYLSRKSPEGAWLAWGIILGNLVFVLQYRVHAQAADTLPLVFASVWLIGAGLAQVMPRPDVQKKPTATPRTIIAAVAFLAATVWTIYHAETRYSEARYRDAVPFLQRVDFPALPERAVVFADWQRSRPLWYARSVMFDRADVRIVTTRGEIEQGLWPAIADRPVFCSSPRGAPEGWHFIRERALWRLMRDE